MAYKFILCDKIFQNSILKKNFDAFFLNCWLIQKLDGMALWNSQKMSEQFTTGEGALTAPENDRHRTNPVGFGMMNGFHSNLIPTQDNFPSLVTLQLPSLLLLSHTSLYTRTSPSRRISSQFFS